MTTTETSQACLTGIEQAVQNVGGQRALAEKLLSRFPDKPNLSQQAVSQWCQQGFVPSARAWEVSHIAGVPVRLLVSQAIRDLIDS